MKSTNLILVLMVLAICCSAVAKAQNPAPAQKAEAKPAVAESPSVATPVAENSDDEVLIWKVYTIGNLKPPASKAYLRAIPTTEDWSTPTDEDGGTRMSGHMGGMGGGMGMGGMGMGGMGGMMGGGMAEPKDTQSKTPAKTPAVARIEPLSGVDQLIDVITKTLAPTTWDSVGGPGSIQPYKNRDLVISQTLAVHQEIRKLLETINAGGGTSEQSMVVEAYWLLLDYSQLERLKMPAKTDSKKIRLSVNPKVLEELVRTVPALRGQIACFNNQTVHIVAGDRRNVLTSSIPVVGTAGDAGYQPVAANVNIGALLQVCPSYIPGMNSATVDIDSTVTGWREGLDPVKIQSTTPSMDVPADPTPGAPSTKQPGKSSSVTLMDHLQMPAHQLACTLRVPLGKPVLVGGLTLDPTKFDASENKSGDAKNAEPKPVEKKQLYLIIRVSECEDE
jgi:hypothetical protein